MKPKHQLAILLVFLALGSPLFPAAGAERPIPGMEISAGGAERLAAQLRPEPLRKAEKFYNNSLRDSLNGMDPTAVNIHDPGFKVTREQIIELYRQGGFESVKAMAKSGDIAPGASQIIAAVRNAMVNEAISTMAGYMGEVRVNDFSTAPTAQSDIDQTFHPVMEPDPDRPGNERVARDPETGEPLTGLKVRERFNSIFDKIFKIDPERMEVSSHASEGTIPDWRKASSFDDFALRLARGSQILMDNSEAYFLEGAFRRQVDRRSFESDTPLFRIYRPLRKYETVAQVLHVRPQVDVTHSRARIEVFNEVPPEWRQGYAFGASVGNLLFFQHHDKPEEVAERAKYLMRSMEDGMASLTLEDDKPSELYFDLSDADRREMLRKAYPDADMKKLQHIYLMYETAGAVRKNRNNMSDPAAKEKALRYAMLQVLMEKEQLGKASEAVRRLNELDPEARGGLVKDAEIYFRKASHTLLVENTVRAARARVQDWLDPKRIDPKKLPRESREAFTQDPETFLKKLKLAAASEFVDAFTRLDSEVAEKIIAAEPNPDYRGKLRGMKEAADLRRHLFDSPSRGFLDDATPRLRKIGNDLVRAHGDLDAQWRSGAYDEPGELTRMRDGVKAEMGYYREGDLQKLAQAASAAGTSWDTEAIAGQVFDLGNVESVLSIVQAGQRSEWDWKAVGWAAGMELISNIEGVSPVLTGYSVLVEGEYEGAAVMMASYVFPVVGQVYTFYNVTNAAVEIVDFDIQQSIAGMVYQGYTPPERGGFWGVVNALRPGTHIAEQADTFSMHQPPTVLHFVPGRTFSERRKNVFQTYDSRVLRGVDTTDMEAVKINEERQKRAPAVFEKLVTDYWTGTGEFATVKIPGGAIFRNYLTRPEVRQGLVANCVKDYLAGMLGLRMRNGQKKEIPDTARKADETAALLDRLHAAHSRLGRNVKKQLPLASGLPDFPDWSHQDIDGWKRWVTAEDGKPIVEIEVPEGPLTPGDLTRLRGKCAARPDMFKQPYSFEWEILGLSERKESAQTVRGLTFSQGWTEAKSVKVQLTVKDAAQKLIGTATTTLQLGEAPEGDVGVTGTYRLIQVTTTYYSSEGKRRGDSLDVITEECWIPVLVTPERSFETALGQRHKGMEQRHGPAAGNDQWRSRLNMGMSPAFVGWAVEASEESIGTPFKPEEVPARKRSVKAGGGPRW